MNTTVTRHATTAFAACVLALAAIPAWSAPPKQGDMAPDLVGITLDREHVQLSKYQGQAVVVSFWATWCPYCLKELPILNGIRKASKGNIQVIAVNTEDRDVFRKVVKIMAPLDLRMSYDPDQSAQQAYGVTGLPHLVVIGRDGKIVSTFRGYSEESLPAIVDAINYATGAQQ